MHSAQFPNDKFADILDANRSYAENFHDEHLTGRAAKGLAIITCMDSRISPLDIMGLNPGDVKILRNAGARVTEDVLRTLVLATFLLGVDRILVMPHTDCRMASATEQEIHEAIQKDYGVDTRSVEFRTVRDQLGALAMDVTRVRTYPLLAPNVTVAGAVFDVHTGSLNPIDI